VGNFPAAGTWNLLALKSMDDTKTWLRCNRYFSKIINKLAQSDQ